MMKVKIELYGATKDLSKKKKSDLSALKKGKSKTEIIKEALKKYIQISLSSSISVGRRH